MKDQIVGARFILQGHKVLNSNDESNLVRELRDICHSSKYNVTVFHPYFIYFDQVIGNWSFQEFSISSTQTAGRTCSNADCFNPRTLLQNFCWECERMTMRMIIFKHVTRPNVLHFSFWSFCPPQSSVSPLLPGS